MITNPPAIYQEVQSMPILEAVREERKRQLLSNFFAALYESGYKGNRYEYYLIRGRVAEKMREHPRDRVWDQPSLRLLIDASLHELGLREIK